MSPRRNAQGSVSQQSRSAGLRISRARKASGLTLQQLASAIGVSSQQVHKYELDGDSVSVSRLSKIAEILNVSVVYLISEEQVEGYSLEQSDEVANLLNARGAHEICRLYNSISDKSLRQDVLKLVAGVASIIAR